MHKCIGGHAEKDRGVPASIRNPLKYHCRWNGTSSHQNKTAIFMIVLTISVIQITLLPNCYATDTSFDNLLQIPQNSI